jgi:hypothetical protein
VSELAPGVTRRAHLAQDRVERDVAGELGEIIIAPDDWIRADETVAELDLTIRGSGTMR